MKNCKACEHFPWKDGFNLELLPQARCHIALSPRNWTEQQAVGNTDCQYFKAKVEASNIPAEQSEVTPKDDPEKPDVSIPESMSEVSAEQEPPRKTKQNSRK